MFDIILQLTLATTLVPTLSSTSSAPPIDPYCIRRPKTPEISFNAEKTKLTIGTFLPSNVIGNGPLNDSLLPAIKLALDDLIDHQCILKQYSLDVRIKDTNCKASIGTKAFFEMMHSKPRKVALFGDACTVVNGPIALTAKYWNIVQVSYAETHPKFSGTDSSTMYPTFYRMVPADRALNDARFRFLQYYNWTQVGTVKQSDESKYALPHETFTTDLGNKHNITVVETAEVSSEKLHIGSAIDELKAKDARIIIADLNATFAVKLLCEAFHKNEMYGPNYVWILPGYHRKFWWLQEQQHCNCSIADLTEVLDGHFLMEFGTVRQDQNTKTISGMSSVDYMSRYMKACQEEKRCDVNNPYHPYVYDGIWALAVALDQVSLTWSTVGDPISPNTFTTEGETETFHRELQSALNTTLFEGVTGRVKFEDNERLGIIQIAQFKNGTYFSVGYFDASQDDFQLDEDKLHTLGWRPPLDSTLKILVRQYISFELYVVMCSLAVIGMVLALVFLAINVHFRTHKFIRMSSPNINNLIIAGSILTYLSVVLLGVDTRLVSPAGFTAFCYAKTWVLSIGFTLSFGSMFSKTWRVHSIFTNIKLNKKAIKDYKLFLMLAMLLLIDTTVLAVWAAVSPMRMNVAQLLNDVEQIDHNRVQIPEIERCYSEHSLVFQAILYSFKGLLMILGCFLAWETRQVNVPALNDSKYIGMSVYNVVLMCVLGLALSFILTDKVNEAYMIICMFIIFCTTLTLCLVFVPKVIELIRNPKGTEKRYRHGMMKVMNNAGKINRTGSIQSLNGDRDKLMRLEQDNQVWHSYLAEKIHESSELMRQLKELGDDPDEKDSALESSSDAFDDVFGGVYIGPPLTPPLGAERAELHNVGENGHKQLVHSNASPHLREANEKTSLLPNNRNNGGNGPILAKLRTSLNRRSYDMDSESSVVIVQRNSLSEPSSRPGSMYYSYPDVSTDSVPLETIYNAQNSTHVLARINEKSDEIPGVHQKPKEKAVPTFTEQLAYI